MLPIVVWTAAQLAVAQTPEPAPAPAPEPAADTGSPWTWALHLEGVARSWEDNPLTQVQLENIVDGMQRFYGTAGRGAFEAGLQLDVAFAGPNDRAALVTPETPPVGATSMVFFQTELDDDADSGDASAAAAFAQDPAAAAVLEKKFLRWRGDAAFVEVGDTYRALGRGLLLALVKNTELDIDTSIEGANVEANFGAFEIGVWGGLSNPQTVSTAFPNHLARDARDTIYGGRMTARVGGVELFVHGNDLLVDPRVKAQSIFRGELLEVEKAEGAGGGFSVPDLAGKADVYVEAVGVDIHAKDGAGDAVRREGYAVYGVANAYVGGLTVTLEGKRYRLMELLNVRQSEGTASPYDYVTPPTLEKENVVNFNMAEAVNSNDIAGGRIAVSGNVGPVLARVSYAQLEDQGHLRPGFSNGNERIHHLYGGVEKRASGWFVQGTVGTRYETRLAEPDKHDTMVHGDLDVLVPIGSVPFEAKALAYRQLENSTTRDEEITIDAMSLTVSVRPVRWIALAGLLDTTTEERVVGNAEGNLSRYTFGAAEITVEPTERSTMRLFVGATQGGLKCSGGTCRVIPAFEGVRLEWLARF